jgi:hypothetical protein
LFNIQLIVIDNCTVKPSFRVEGNSDDIFGMKYDYEHGFSEELNQFITRKINGTCTCIRMQVVMDRQNTTILSSNFTHLFYFL